MCLSKTEAKIGILPIHEEILVEQANALYRSPRNQNAGTREKLNFVVGTQR